MIHLKGNNELVLMRGTEKLKSVKAMSKLSPSEKTALIEYAWYLYGKEGNFLYNLSDVDREKKIDEMGIDVSEISDTIKTPFLEDVASAFLCSEEKLLRTMLNQIDKQGKVFANMDSTSKQIKDAHEIIKIMQEQVITLQEQVSLIRRGSKANDSRMSLFEIPE